MKRWDSKGEEKTGGSKSNTGKKKNLRRLGGTGLSLEAFANAKSMNKHYNPAFKKRQREFYKNAKCVSKYKKSLKQQNQQNDISSAVKSTEDRNQTRYGDKMKIKNKNKKNQSLEQVYEKKHEEEEQARREREAIIQAKKEERDKAEAQRKEMRARMFKKTRYGQPVMKYRIERLLQTIQGSSENSSNNN